LKKENEKLNKELTELSVVVKSLTEKFNLMKNKPVSVSESKNENTDKIIKE
jgi:hypothetical protein